MPLLVHPLMEKHVIHVHAKLLFPVNNGFYNMSGYARAILKTLLYMYLSSLQGGNASLARRMAILTTSTHKLIH